MRPHRALVCLLLALVAAPSLADEGMWPLYDLDKLDFADLAARGLALSANEIFNHEDGGLAKAVVDLGGGTGSFVSPEGLIVTNYHVAFGAIQRQSRGDRNLLDAGFHAATRAEEIPAIGYRCSITLAVADVTARVLDALDPELDDLARFEAIDRITKEIVAEVEVAGDVKCRVARMHGGTQFILTTTRELRDVRIVHVPPAAIGQYGGDVDNWMWPRHTGDYSFLRAYTAPDGSSAEHAPENVPYRPDRWLRVATDCVREGAMALVIGFPGRTSRYVSSWALAAMQEGVYPRMVEQMEDVLAIYEDFGARDPEIRLRLADRVSTLNNFLKKNRGMLEGLAATDAVALRRTDERRLTRFLRRHPDLRRRYGGVLGSLRRLYRDERAGSRWEGAVGGLGMASQLYGLASTVTTWAVEREKPDLERERGYQERDAQRALMRLRFAQINLLPEVDRAVLRYALDRMAELPSDQRVAAMDSIFGGRDGEELDRFLDGWLDDLYARTRVGDLDARLAMFEMDRAELEALGDPFIDLAVALRPAVEAARERRKQFQSAESRLTPQFIAAYAAWKRGDLYPDANGTKRFSAGAVLGYGPCEDPRYPYLTTLGGLMAKATGVEPFQVPEALRAAHAAGDFGPWADAVAGDVPVDFLTTNDSTNGSSGSPVLNGRGELVGLLFDGNYESIAGDYIFDPALTRAIVVDVRYVLFLLDKVFHHEELLAELGVR
ncbi:MAG: S46 family peptidase [Candidatus Krumholzibacteriota bacterium]|nr:S46 family peptidase [Candidatus Krumholzibacteriota bacterium]